MNRFNKTTSKDKTKIDYQSQIIQRKNDEIEALKSKISLLEDEIDEKNKIIKSIEPLRKELVETVEDVKSKRDEYNELMSDLMQMRKIMDEEAFNNQWWIVKKLIR